MHGTITAERALTDQGWRDRVRIEVRDGAIVGLEDLADHELPRHHTVAPGFVDLQVNGIDDVDVARAEAAAWERLDGLLAAQGTTTWCPTITTRPIDAYEPALDRVRTAMLRRGPRPDIAGVHLEGPFLGRAHGAHPSRWVSPIDHAFLTALPDHVRVLTLGAEVPGAADAVRLLVERGVVVAIGHCEPDEGEIDAVVAAGARLVTHLFNAMTGIHHRRDGLALHALTDDRLYVSLIADGVHVHHRAMSLVWRARPDAVILVTDAVAWRSPDRTLTVVDGAPRLADGTLAGSCLTMDAAVRASVQAGADLANALRAASTRPAQLLGLGDRGAIAVGRRADLVALDADLRVDTTWSRGVVIHGRVASPA